IIWLESTGQGHFGDTGMTDVLWLLSCGVVTAIPLMIYANGAKLLRLSTIGIMQYIAPTMIFIIAVFAFGEPFGTVKLIAFVFIWAALFIYSGSMLRTARNRRLAAAEVKAAE
ncbi:EamA family transporter, partial [Shinella sp.]